MTKKAFDQIAAGLTEALAVARGEATKVALARLKDRTDPWTPEQIADLEKMPLGPEAEIGKI